MSSALVRVTLIFIALHYRVTHVTGKHKCGPLFLTVTANTVTKIIMNWQFICKEFPDTVLLCASPFKNGCRKTLATANPKDAGKGSFQTEVSFGYHPKFPGGWNENDTHSISRCHCYPYWIISLKNGTKIDENCLKIHPTWMSRFGKLKIGSLLVPGTHNSGTWRGVPVIVRNFILNQDHNLWDQLVSGIRFFDLRIGYKEASESFWINHDVVYVTKLEPELQHVLNFLKKTRKEVIILNFHRFPTKNFTRKIHLKLLDRLYELFGNYMLPRIEDNERQPTLEEIWKTGKKLIVSYNEKEMVKEHKWLWKTINRRWGNKQTPEEMYDYIKEVVNSDVKTPYVLMAEPTLTVWTAIKEISLRHVADKFNPQLHYWLRNEKWDEKLNMVAVDFYLSSDIVNIAIDANEKRLQKIERQKRCT